MDETTFNQALELIKADRARGASELARECLSLIASIARETPASDVDALWSMLTQRVALLEQARPSMAPIHNLLARWRTAAEGNSWAGLATARTQMARSADELIEYSLRAVAETARQTAAHLGPDRTVLTHSLSSTVLSVFRGLRHQGLKVILTESRPLYEGHRLARQLADYEVPATLITEAQIGLFVAKADAVLVGADSLLPDGSVINKVGTYPLALVARDQGVPMYVCCESFKRRPPDMEVPPLEAMGSAELGAPALAGVAVRNIYFDVTPARLVSAWFDERGMHTSWSDRVLHEAAPEQ